MSIFFKETNNQFSLIVLKIDERDIFENLDLSQNSKEKLFLIKSDIHKKQFLASREILNILCIKDKDIAYTDEGKPFFINRKEKISFSHSGNFSAVAVSKKNIGIDIETKFDKVIKVKDKFLSEKEKIIFNTREDYIKSWCSKESIYKILEEKISLPKIILNKEYQFNKKIKTTIFDKNEFFISISVEY